MPDATDNKSVFESQLPCRRKGLSLAIATSIRRSGQAEQLSVLNRSEAVAF